MCGIGGSEYVDGAELAAGRLPPGQVEPDPSRVAAAVAAVSGLSTVLGKRPPVATQACMRPCPPDALPMMGRVPTVDGAFVSAGHNCAPPRLLRFLRLPLLRHPSPAAAAVLLY